MLKKILLILMLSFILPVSAGEFEDALKNYSKVFLYIYTPECGYCKQFDSIYDKLNKKYNNDCKFVKINANTEYGNLVMRMTDAHFVPNVLLINSEKQIMHRVTPKCLLEYACIKDAVLKFVD